ncbi:unnamed protein product [Effrenium voratum]|uniref:Meiosis-specific nuclear structural protein 1 n=1 Tax=Effrenium voratum TaxID=2562239 RepID=A0AA36IZ09_9DINO|nr:unnamed protein product [Effrenium voratum]
MATLRRLEDQVFAACRKGPANVGVLEEGWTRCAFVSGLQPRAEALQRQRASLPLPGEAAAAAAEARAARVAQEREERKALLEREAEAQQEAEDQLQQQKMQAKTSAQAAAHGELQALRRRLLEKEAQQLQQLQVLRQQVEAEEQLQQQLAEGELHEEEHQDLQRLTEQRAEASRQRAQELQREWEVQSFHRQLEHTEQSAAELERDRKMVAAAAEKVRQEDLQSEMQRRQLQRALAGELERLMAQQAERREQLAREQQAAVDRASVEQREKASFWQRLAQERWAAESARGAALQRLQQQLRGQQNGAQRLARLQELLREEEALARQRDQEEAALRRRLEARAKAAQAAQDGIRALEARARAQQAEEDEWRRRFVEQRAEEERLEQMGQQKRRMRLLAFRREAQQQLDERRAAAAKAALQRLEELRAEQREEEDRCRIVEEERRRLLAEHARGGLLGYRILCRSCACGQSAPTFCSKQVQGELFNLQEAELLDSMESVQERSRWVLRNTFMELVEDGSPGFSSGALIRASSDSVLYEGYSPNPADETPKRSAPPEPKEAVEDGHIEFEMNGWSDTETNPDTQERQKPLPCYSHIQDFPSGESTPLCTALPGMDWQPSDFCEVPFKEEEFRPDPLPGVAPPSASSETPADKAASKQDLQRLAAEVARLAQENELLRQQVLHQDQHEEMKSEAVTSTPENMSWVFMPVNFMQPSHQDAMDSWSSAQQDQMRKDMDAKMMARRRRYRGREGELEAQSAGQTGTESLNLGKLRSSNMSVRPAECDLPLEECTTVMLRNLPNNYTRAMLLAMLDNEGFEGKYNFLYLPIDFQSRACLGYAFVNLVDPSFVPNFWEKFSGYSKWVLPSKKVCGVSWSGPHQGLEAHVERYRNSPVMHESVPDEYKPVILQHGLRVAFPEPSKAPRPPRIRQHHHSSDGKAGWHGRQFLSSDPSRTPLAVGALPPGSVSRS